MSPLPSSTSYVPGFSCYHTTVMLFLSFHISPYKTSSHATEQTWQELRVDGGTDPEVQSEVLLQRDS